MKKAILVLALVFGLATFVFAQDDNLLLDDFEIGVVGGPEGTVDFGAGNGSSVEVTSAADVKYWNDLSIKVTYDAVTGGYIYIARGSGLDAKKAVWDVKPETIKWDDYKAISFYMNGTDSKVKVAFDVKDNGGELWRFITEDNFKGWKQIVCPFKGFVARTDWQPETADKNGTIDFPLKSYQFEPLPPAKGVLYFDKVELIKK
ncbi:MAG: carbohydrate binding domain-containing protein [Candidatus Omnitrophica bacterium]|nr:carbohydrate binding domain-containing protein [Candidatus Omnitrophota bacterium]